MATIKKPQQNPQSGLQQQLYQVNGELAILRGIVRMQESFTGCSFMEIINDRQWDSFSERYLAQDDCEMSLKKKVDGGKLIEFYWYRRTRHLLVKMEDGTSPLSPLSPHEVGLSGKEVCMVEYRLADIESGMRGPKLVRWVTNFNVPSENPMHFDTQLGRTHQFQNSQRSGPSPIALKIASNAPCAASN